MSRVSGSMEIKSRQEFVTSVLERKKFAFEEIDISDPTREEDKKFMQKNGKPSGNDKAVLPPQIFCDDTYCGGYDSFFEANEDNILDEFLQIKASE